MGRFADTKDIAESVSFLLSEKASLYYWANFGGKRWLVYLMIKFEFVK